jgi:Redoxin
MPELRRRPHFYDLPENGGLPSQRTTTRSWLRQGLATLLCAAVLAGCAPPPADSPEPEYRYAQAGTRDSFRLSADGGRKATVLFFIGSDCPISNGFVPEMLRLHREFAPTGMGFCAVYADAEILPVEAGRHAADFAFPFPALLDPGQTLARRVGATVMPEAAVLSPTGVLLYRGRIDNRYADFGRLRERPTCTELRDALGAILSGRSIAVPWTPALGCAIVFPNR